ncbi:DUF4238 domain-containing protein [Aurantimonas endophytica]|uniref:DUF4238 domain-containing protein n=1 Tax=Aurantimonas endophytica TaxID=1522175 RepID=UPI001606008D|nr:DUF4238 domain-containing protein [Aurantimonas endophytica]MCO6403529.1 DUF4238 domain-containing protein [Aurantimonas endophytica]
MTSANPSTKHHYIPAFYLRRWAGTDKKVTEFSRPYRDVVVRSVMPERTGYQERLYELKLLIPLTQAHTICSVRKAPPALRFAIP